MFDAWLGMVWTRSLSRAGRPCAFALVTATLLVLPSLVVAQQGATAADSAGGQECRQQGARVSVTRLRGEPIRAIDIVTAPPSSLPGPASVLDNLHVRTRESTVQRRLLFAVGDPVDPARVAESVRSLRRLRYLADVSIEGARCEEGGVGLTVVTRDAWSTRPTLKVRGARTALIGVEERNLFGTGRSVEAYVRSDYGRTGVGIAYTDPWLFGGNWEASVAHNAYSDGGSWEAMLQTRERSIFDRWHTELRALRSVRSAPVGRYGVKGDSVYRDAASLLVSRSVASSPGGVTSLIAGAELDRARAVAGADALIVGPPSVNRTFVGLDVGAARHTARYTSNDWLVGGGPRSATADGMPASAVAQLPMGVEAEGVLGVGRDLVTKQPAVHFDLWGGRIWTPRRDLVVRADAWASGFRVGREWAGTSVRGTVGAYVPASHGLWSANISAESLVDPDPDVRALTALDPILHAVSPRLGLAETAVGISLERSRRFMRLGHGYALDGALFAGASTRWESASRAALAAGQLEGRLAASGGVGVSGGGLVGGADLGVERSYIGVLGGGIQFSPLHFGRAKVRLDVGVPLLHSPGIRGRPYLALSIVPSLTSARRRDGSAGSW
jgi:hypothetical protein